MIRPVTIATFLMACGSGLYLYQSKHEAQMLDRTIEHTVHDTAALREQTRLLATEFTMLASPERLRQFADQYLPLKSIDPKQFTSLADLDAKLPPVAPPSPDALPPVPMAAAAPFDTPAHAIVPVSTEMPLADDADSLPAPKHYDPPRSAAAVAPHMTEKRVVLARPPAAEVSRATESRGAEAPRTAETHPAAEPRASDPHPAPRLVDAHLADVRPAVDVRPVAARQAVPVSRPPLQAMHVQAAPVAVVPASATITAAAPAHLPPAPMPVRPATIATNMAPVAAPYGGSLLGMARGASAAPRPTPVIGINAN